MKTFVAVSLVLFASAAGWGISGNLENGAYFEPMQQSETLDFGDGARIGLLRNRVDIPAAYGKLISIVPTGTNTVLWFQADDGSMRNAVVGSTQMIIIQRRGKLVD